MTRPSEAIIDLHALKQNYAFAHSLACDGNTIAVIKANAYGHGMIPVAKALESQVPAFAIACTDEAIELRNAGITKPLLLLEGFFSNDEITLSAQHHLWLMVENQCQVEALISTKLSYPLTVWLKVDTGMHRLGMPIEQAQAAYRQLQASSNVVKPIVLATHFACADEPENPATRQQIEQFKTLAATLQAPMSLCNSPGLLAWPEARAQWNRPGYMLYGNSPFTSAHPEAAKLIPVMTFQSKVMALRTVKKGEAVGYGATWKATRDSIIATVPVGYGDGYPRNAPSGTPVLVNGHLAKLAGRVSMDLITVDVTDLEGVTIGSEVELWGKRLSVDDVARPASTIGYELLTRIPARLRRRYVGED